MAKYILRLDDASEQMDIEQWKRMEELLDKYSIKPLVGIIPCCEDISMSKYKVDPLFWKKVKNWTDEGWIIAMHGYNHVYSTSCGDLNPVNKRSEFAGEPLFVQKEKIKRAVQVFEKHGFKPKVFFAPSHTFDDFVI